jgi:CDP-diacylglycerol--serine O-phosphatidyltransferase
MPSQIAQTTREKLSNLVRLRRRGIYIYALPNILTSGNFILGFMAILYAADGKFINAAWSILISSIFDLLDGRVARLTNTTSRFGVEFDSLCDLVSFGVAPATLMYFSSMHSYHRLGMAAAALYGLCGALRLARFNVLADVLPKSYFQGLPIPMASMVVATGVLFANELGITLENNPVVPAVAIFLGLLMVSTLKFPSFKDFHLRQRRSLPLIAFSLTVVFLLFTWFEISAFLLFCGYILLSLITDFIRSRKRWQKQSNTA